jgi:hypothetical protein
MRGGLTRQYDVRRSRNLTERPHKDMTTDNDAPIIHHCQTVHARELLMLLGRRRVIMKTFPTLDRFVSPGLHRAFRQAGFDDLAPASAAVQRFPRPQVSLLAHLAAGGPVCKPNLRADCCWLGKS